MMVFEEVCTVREYESENVQVVIATIAFGMGIDKPNVRHVIHYGWPQVYFHFLIQYTKATFPCIRTINIGTCAHIKYNTKQSNFQ